MPVERLAEAIIGSKVPPKQASKLKKICSQGILFTTVRKLLCDKNEVWAISSALESLAIK